MDFRKIDWFSAKPSKERLVVGAAVIGLLAAGYVIGRGDADGNASVPAANAASSSEASAFGQQPGAAAAPVAAAASNLVPLTPIGAGQCRTLAPEGWRVTDQNKDGTVFTLQSPDGRLTAAYAGVAIGSGQAQGYYGPQFRTPETFALYAVRTVTGEEAHQVGAPEQVGPYQAIRFASASHSGYVLLYRFQVPDPGGYGVMMRIAVGNPGDDRSVGIAGSVVAAARCTAVLHPSEGPVYHAPREDHGTGRSGNDSDLAGTYNAQLGTGWVHDDAGRNYNVDVTRDWRENGPDGPGYYKGEGVNTQKLQPGMS